MRIKKKLHFNEILLNETDREFFGRGLMWVDKPHILLLKLKEGT